MMKNILQKIENENNIWKNKWNFFSSNPFSSRTASNFSKNLVQIEKPKKIPIKKCNS